MNHAIDLSLIFLMACYLLEYDFKVIDRFTNKFNLKFKDEFR